MNAPLSPDEQTLAESYEAGLPLLKRVCAAIQSEAEDALQGLAHIDRISFRTKGANSFGRKGLSLKKTGGRRYVLPLEEIEDQIAGRVTVFFKRDIGPVVQALCTRFTAAEHVYKEPSDASSFSYESDHLVFVIPPQCQLNGWQTSGRPKTFEMQVRTLFMHAWAEPTHDYAYKGDLTGDQKRLLAWAASNAWGGDEILDQLVGSISSGAAGRN